MNALMLVEGAAKDKGSIHPRIDTPLFIMYYFNAYIIWEESCHAENRG